MVFKHFYVFEKNIGKKLDKEAWDKLRREGESAFAIEHTKDLYELNCEKKSEYIFWAKRILQVKDIGTNFFSFGCGKGVLEWHLKKIAGDKIRVTCSDYTPEQIEKLKKVNTLCDAFLLFDMMRDDYEIIDCNSTVIIFRCSTELTVQQFKEVFRKLYNRGIEKIIFVPTEIITFKEGIRRYKVFFREWIKGNNLTFCGWSYSEAEMEKMFSDYYDI